MSLVTTAFLIFSLTTIVTKGSVKLSDQGNVSVVNLANKSENLENITQVKVLDFWKQLSEPVVLSNATNKECKRDTEIYLNSLDRLELWALKMFDATAKVSAGILSGNSNQYGAYDECLSIEGVITGKYCLASLQINFNGQENMEVIDSLVHNGHVIRSNMIDVGHVVPPYSSKLWGICIPNSCNGFDIEEELSQRLSKFGISVRVPDTMCSIKNFKRSYSFGRTISVAFFLVVILLLCLGTIVDDDKIETTSFKRFLNAFSLKRNLRTLFTFSNASSRMKGIDAYRGINMFALYLVHKCMTTAYKSYVNKVSYSDVLNSPLTLGARSGILFTDSFLYLAGFLNAHSLLQELKREGTINFGSSLLGRWFRLFPAFGSMMLFVTYILPDLSHGPQWNMVIDVPSRICKRHIWKSFFFIHNYFGLENMCQFHTHQIGLDMQLYVASLFLTALIWKSRTLGLSLLGVLAIISTVLRYLAPYWYNINMYLQFEVTGRSSLDTSRYSYSLPTHRATIYFAGVFMAYLITSKNLNYKLTNIQVKLLWIFCAVLALFTILSPYRMGLKGYKYEPYSAAVFAAFSPILWGVFMFVSHWAICHDYAGIGTPFIESRVFQFLNKIGYTVYLTQYPIFLYNVGVQRHEEYFSYFYIFDIPEFFTVIIISTITTLAIEMPFSNVYKTYFGHSQKTIKDE